MLEKLTAAQVNAALLDLAEYGQVSLETPAHAGQIMQKADLLGITTAVLNLDDRAWRVVVVNALRG